MTTQENFFEYLLKDTNDSSIHWAVLGESSYAPNQYHKRSENTPLEKWLKYIEQDHIFPQNILIASIIDGFVYIAKRENLPPIYTLYLQTNSKSEVIRLNFPSELVYKLYTAAIQSLNVMECEVSNFMNDFLHSHPSDPSASDDPL